MKALQAVKSKGFGITMVENYTPDSLGGDATTWFSFKANTDTIVRALK